MKMLAVKTGAMDFIKLGLAADVATLGLMFKNWFPELMPFVPLFVAETVALAKLAL